MPRKIVFRVLQEFTKRNPMFFLFEDKGKNPIAYPVKEEVKLTYRAGTTIALWGLYQLRQVPGWYWVDIWGCMFTEALLEEHVRMGRIQAVDTSVRKLPRLL
jgi:hypothetical protein